MNELVQYMSTTGLYNVVGASPDSKSGLEILQAYTVDILLIDLTSPESQGLHLLNEMAFLPGQKPFFVFFANDEYKKFNSIYDYVLAKPKILSRWNLNRISNYIYDMWQEKTGQIPTKKKMSRKLEDISQEELTYIPRRNKKGPKEYIQNLLSKLGVPLNLNGNAYLQSAFVLAIEAGHVENGDITKHIYPAVARQYKTTASHVERCIRYMTLCTMKKGRDIIITNYLGVPMMQPGEGFSNSVFLSTLVYCYHRDRG